MSPPDSRALEAYEEEEEEERERDLTEMRISGMTGGASAAIKCLSSTQEKSPVYNTCWHTNITQIQAAYIKYMCV